MTKKKKFKLNKDIKQLLIIGLIGTILSYIFMGIYFTLLLVFGILGILFCSFLVNKLRKKKNSRKIINVLIILFLIACIAGVLGTGLFFLYVIKNAPEFDPNKLVYSESTLIYDKNGKKIAELGTEKREIITYDQMSEVLVDAIVATEDSRFFQHNGFDAARFIKASAGQAIGRSNAGGASTLSMQVIKNSFTSKEASGIEGIVRKFTDIYLSVFKLEKNYTKQEIIEFYVNNHFLGNNAYGVEQAARTYFGKSASQLNLAEASLIVGLFKAPTAYNPYENINAATERRATVLKLMYTHGYISEEEMKLANSIPIESLLVTQNENSLKYQAYIDTVVAEIEEKYNVNPYDTPMQIYTNMDASKQQAIDDIFSGKNFDWENSYIQAGVAAVDSNTGKIIAIGAGRNRKGASSYNFATMINRQIGSTSKPVIDYAPGMEYLNWSTATIFKDEKWYYSNGKIMRNSDRSYRGDMSIREAISKSRNVPALKAFQQVSAEIGLDEYKKFIESFGIKTEEYLHEAHSVGSFNGSNPLTMAAAYAVFSNGGYYYEPYSVNKIIYRDTGEVIEYSSEGKRIISDSTAYMLTSCMITAVQSGLSNGAKISGYNIAAKTGTTNYDAAIAKKYGLPSNAIPDSWIIGYDPEISIGLWYGCKNIDKEKYMSVNSAGSQKGKLFRAIAKIVLTKGKNFKVPSSVVKVAIEKGSNPIKLASEQTPENQIIYEYFKAGTEPTETSVKYNKHSNVTNLDISYNASDLSLVLNWNGVSNKNKGDISTYGDFGYKIYKDGKCIGFTTETSYTMLNVSNPNGTYKVVTTYENYSDNASSGVSKKYELASESNFYITLKYSVSTYETGDTLSTYDSTPSKNDLIVMLDTENVTEKSNIDITITNKNGDSITSIDTSISDNYTITYKINYKTYSKTVSRKVNIG